MDNKVITLWYRYNKEEFEFQYNHLSDGYVDDQLFPSSPDEKVSKGWKNSKWEKYEGRLIDGVAYKLDH